MANTLLPSETRCAECGGGVSLTRCYADFETKRALCEAHWLEYYKKRCADRGFHQPREWTLLSDGSVQAICYCEERRLFDDHRYVDHEHFLTDYNWAVRWPI